jgi:Tfp pilus assembly PilM family ATPase
VEFFDRGARIAILTRHKGRFVVSDLVDVEFPPVSEGQTQAPAVKAAAVREALRSRGWRLREIALVLPKNLVTMRLVMLPSIHDAELVEMARFEAQKHIPFNVERHVIAHTVLRKEGVEGSRTLIVAVDRAAFEEPLAICREARFDVTTACVSSLALVEALLLDPPAGHAEQTFALVNLGWSTVDITIISGGIVRFTRSGTIGLERIAPFLREVIGPKAAVTGETLAGLDALDPQSFFEKRGRPVRRRAVHTVDDFEADEADEGPRKGGVAVVAGGEAVAEPAASALTGPAGEIDKWLGRLVQEIHRTHTFAVHEFECPPLETVYLAGIGSYVVNMGEYLQKNLTCPVVLIPPPASLDFAAPKGRDLRGVWREYAITIGAVAGSSLPPVSLLPPEYTETLLVRKRKRALAIMATLAFLLCALAAGYGVRWVRDQRHQVEFYRAHNENLSPRVTNLNNRERHYRIIREIVVDPRSAGAILEMLSRLDLVRQRKITLLDYHYIKGDKVQLEGHALSYADLDRFAAELEKFGLDDGATTGTASQKNRTFDLVQQKSRPTVPLPGGRPTVIKFNLDCLFPKSEGR